MTPIMHPALPPPGALARVGRHTHDRRKGTLRLNIDYSAAASADQLAVTAVVDGGKTLRGSFAKPGGTSGSAEIDFGKASPAGTKVTVTVTALAASVRVAS